MDMANNKFEVHYPEQNEQRQSKKSQPEQQSRFFYAVAFVAEHGIFLFIHVPHQYPLYPGTAPDP